MFTKRCEKGYKHNLNLHKKPSIANEDLTKEVEQKTSDEDDLPISQGWVYITGLGEENARER